MEQRRVADRELAPAVVTETKPGPRREERPEIAKIAKENGVDPSLVKDVRASDIEPYTGLRYLSKLFKLMAVVLLLLLVAEVITGLSTQGSAAIPTLLGEASRLLVFSGLLWGSGDLAHLLIDMGHDVRATRVLMSRQVHHLVGPKGTKGTLGASSNATTTTVADVSNITTRAAMPPEVR
jgi:hypothetical protein